MAVGALEASGNQIAPWSNRGGWVDVYARGADVVNAYPKEVYTYVESTNPPDPVDFSEHGLASWSGTSFSTPLVAGLVAARMSWTHEKGPQAWASLARLAWARADGGIWVLGPGDADSARAAAARPLNDRGGWSRARPATAFATQTGAVVKRR